MLDYFHDVQNLGGFYQTFYVNPIVLQVIVLQTPWRWSQEWPKHVGAKNNRHVTLHKCAFVGSCMNNKFTLMHRVEHIKLNATFLKKN